ncbi:MAG: hypothetical protein PHW69_04805 [Elusimicrobiaceae bacterium]|nr:hypothetical protein [Elusimicrobiaceae bacterium]
MNPFELLAILVILCDIALCATGRLRVLIRAAAVQGAALGLLPLARHISSETILLVCATIGIKAFLFPYLLLRALEKSGAEREPKPYISYNLSLGICAALFAVSAWLAAALDGGEPLMTAAFFSVFSGFFVMTARKSAFSQAIGYLVLEGGIYAFGMTLPGGSPAPVELGLLLDILMAAFIIGLMLYNISREFAHADMARISFLSEAEDYD